MFDILVLGKPRFIYREGNVIDTTAEGTNTFDGVWMDVNPADYLSDYLKEYVDYGQVTFQKNKYGYLKTHVYYKLKKKLESANLLVALNNATCNALKGELGKIIRNQPRVGKNNKQYSIDPADPYLTTITELDVSKEKSI